MEQSSGTYVTAQAVVGVLASDHCGYYVARKSVAVTGFFRNQLRRTCELVAYRGWTCLLLDRRCLVQGPNALRC